MLVCCSGWTALLEDLMHTISLFHHFVVFSCELFSFVVVTKCKSLVLFANSHLIGIYQQEHASRKKIRITETFVNVRGIFNSLCPTKSFTQNMMNKRWIIINVIIEVLTLCMWRNLGDFVQSQNETLYCTGVHRIPRFLPASTLQWNLRGCFTERCAEKITGCQIALLTDRTRAEKIRTENNGQTVRPQ